MSIEDRIAKSLLKKHAGYLTATQSDGWFTSIESQLETNEQLEYKRARIMIGDTELECLIAEDGAAQTQGLQGHHSLGSYEAMIFPYHEPRRVAFHMGEVTFPIDMIFVGSDSRVTRIVEDIEPGTPGNWGMPHIVAVVEVNGGFCRAHNIEVGSEVGQIDSKTAQINEDVEPAANPVDDFYDGNLDIEGLFAALAAYPSKVSLIEGIKRKHYDAVFETEQQTVGMLESQVMQVNRIGSVKFAKFAAAKGFIPAFYDHKFNKVIPSPGFHNIEVLGDAFDEDPTRFLDGFVDNQGRFYTRKQMQKLHDVSTSEELWQEQQSGENPNYGKGLAQPKKTGQEIFPSYTRKDINPKMVTPNVTRDRFKDRDLVDEQVQDQPMDPSHFEQEIGYDQGNTEEQSEGIGPNVRPL